MRVSWLRAILLSAVSLSASFGASCPSELGEVKMLTDSLASSIKLTQIKNATIAEMRDLKRPSGVTKDRVSGTETTVFRIKARLTNYKREDDSDYHLVLEDDDGGTMIAEIPSPACVTDSPVKKQIEASRKAFDAVLHATTKMKDTDVPVVVTGVGFFDVPHGGAGQLGHAPNNIELHPVLDIKFEAAPPSAPPSPTDETRTFATDEEEERTGPARAAAAAQSDVPPSNLYWTIFWLMTGFYVVFLLSAVITLRRSSNWSLGDALREDGKPSSSRLIAFLGLLVLMVIYIGISYVAVWRLLHNEPLPDVSSFLLSGLTVFAPYMVNQVKSMVQGAASGGVSGGAGGNAPKSPPKVISVTPNSVSAGVSTQLTINGAGFDPRATLLITTPGAPVTPTATITPNQIQVSITMPASTAPYIAVVHIVNSDGAEATGSFQVA